MDNDTILLSGRDDFTTVEIILHHAGQTIIGLLMLFSIFTNFIAMYVLLNTKFGNRTSAKYLYANISLTDELFILTNAVQVMIYGQSCDVNCRALLGYCITISGFVSSYTMAFIAFKRYQAIAFPFKNQQITLKLPIFVIISIIWAFAITVTFIFMKYEKVTEHNENLFLKTCTMLTYTVVSLNTYPYFPLIGMVVVPLLFGLIFSFKAIYALHKVKPVGEAADIDKLNLKRKRKFKSIFMIATVIIAFAMCWLPITLLFIYDNHNYSNMQFCDYNYSAYFIFTILLMLEFWINPVVYWYMNPDFRLGINHILQQTKNKLQCRIFYK